MVKNKIFELKRIIFEFEMICFNLEILFLVMNGYTECLRLLMEIVEDSNIVDCIDVYDRYR